MKENSNFKNRKVKQIIFFMDFIRKLHSNSQYSGRKKVLRISGVTSQNVDKAGGNAILYGEDGKIINGSDE